MGLLNRLNNVSSSRKKIFFVGVALIVTFTIIHNPRSGYHTSYDSSGNPIRESNCPVSGVQPEGGKRTDVRYVSHGYLDLGRLSTYFDFVGGTIILTALGILLAGKKEE